MSKSTLKLLPTLMIAIAAALLTPSAHGLPLTLSFASPLEIGVPGTTLGFSATLTNTTGSTIFLNADSLTVAFPIVVDDTPFFSFPLSLSAGQSFSGLILNATIPLSTTPGDYAGSFEVDGGSDGNAQDTLATAPFTVRIAGASVPDTGSTAILLAASTLGLICARRLVTA